MLCQISGERAPALGNLDVGQAILGAAGLRPGVAGQ